MLAGMTAFISLWGSPFSTKIYFNAVEMAHVTTSLMVTPSFFVNSLISIRLSSLEDLQFITPVILFFLSLVMKFSSPVNKRFLIMIFGIYNGLMQRTIMRWNKLASTERPWEKR